VVKALPSGSSPRWPANGRGRYVALFNTSGGSREVGLPLDEFNLRGSITAYDLWTKETSAVQGNRFAKTLPAHGSGLYLLST